MKSRILISLILILLLANGVHAIAGSIKPPRMVLRENVTVNQVTAISASVEVSNPNDFAINVTMGGSSIIQIDGTPFRLNPDEDRVVNFDILIPGPGDYSGDVTAVFSASGRLPLSLSTEVIVYAEEGEVASNTHSPTKPGLLNPENGYSNHDNIVDLVWNPSSDSDGDPILYYYDVDDDKTFSSPDFHGLTSDTQKSITVNYGTTYFWKITAFDGVHNVSSDVWNFTAVNELPEVPVLFEPLNNSNLNEEPVLVWDESTDMDSDLVSYQVLVDNNADFSSPEINNDETSTTFDTLGKLQSGKYYWKVRSTDGIDNSAYSEVWTFTLTLPATTTPTTTPTTAPSSGGGGGGGGGGSGGSSGSGSPRTSSTTTAKSTTTIQPENQNTQSAGLNNQKEPEQVTGQTTGGTSGGIIVIIILIAIGAVIIYFRRPMSYRM
jgi:hypothetical protein